MSLTSEFQIKKYKSINCSGKYFLYSIKQKSIPSIEYSGHGKIKNVPKKPCLKIM